ncbi:MAG: hydroxyacylglutathione hydrolase [Alphaproteobacteria bacterium]|nr:hydroxyacylglutathione hydrolase [Alphaproteobacteria bacterium]
MTLDVSLIPMLQDNYGHLIVEPETGTVGVVDPPEAPPVLAALAERGLGLDWILITHHHGDHIGGIPGLTAATGARVVGPRADQARVPGLTLALGDGERFAFGATSAVVMDVPGHTRGHIAFWFDRDQAVFAGDTLFSLGCGRMFEGTPQQMWHSLARLRALPGETRMFCAHEYTASNGRFAATIEPDNADLRQRLRDVADLRAAGQPTLPTTIAQECRTNPFLRVDVPAVAAAVGTQASDPVATFAALRRAKDGFKG